MFHASEDAQDVAVVLSGIAATGITVWLDGGWCVDALVGRQLRRHDDLDLAVARSSEPALRSWFSERGYSAVDAEDATPWNYAVADREGHRIDVHVFAHDEHGNPSYGVPYPSASLTGTASLAGVPVRCISAAWLFRFKTAYAPREKDLIDVRALAQAYGFAVPPTHAAG